MLDTKNKLKECLKEKKKYYITGEKKTRSASRMVSE